jgi:L-2,4-diaminobutyrate transaminase
MDAMALRNRTLEDIDRETVLHPFTVLNDFAQGKLGDPRIVETGQGCRIRDRKGNELLDGFAGLYCVNIGYGRREVADAIYEQAKKLAFYQTYAAHSTESLIRLSDRLVSMVPGRPSRVFYGLSGSDANETQVKLVWYYNNVLGRPRKKKIIARDRGYHGASILSGSLTGMSFYHTAFDLPVSGVRHTRVPHHWRAAEPGESEEAFSERCAHELEDLILAEDPDTVAAFIAEPVLGTGGIIPPPREYFAAIQPVLKRYNILLIADEVITGFGRTGRMFGSELYGLEPDLVTLAKGLTSVAAVEFVASREPRRFFDPGLKVVAKVSAACLEEGLIARAMPHDDILGFSPPLIATSKDIDEIVSRLDRATRRVLEGLLREGVKVA